MLSTTCTFVNDEEKTPTYSTLIHLGNRRLATIIDHLVLGPHHPVVHLHLRVPTPQFKIYLSTDMSEKPKDRLRDPTL